MSTLYEYLDREILYRQNGLNFKLIFLGFNDIKIKWGDHTSSHIKGQLAEHNYEEFGTYCIKISADNLCLKYQLVLVKKETKNLLFNIKSSFTPLYVATEADNRDTSSILKHLTVTESPYWEDNQFNEEINPSYFLKYGLENTLLMPINSSLYSGRMWFTNDPAWGKVFGVTDSRPLDPKVTGKPAMRDESSDVNGSALFPYGDNVVNTICEKIEYTLNDQNVLYINSTAVDSYNMNVNFQIQLENKTLGPVGFKTSRAVIIDKLIGIYAKTDNITKLTYWTNGIVYKNGSNIVRRILSPNKIDGQNIYGEKSYLGEYMNECFQTNSIKSFSTQSQNLFVAGINSGIEFNLENIISFMKTDREVISAFEKLGIIKPNTNITNTDIVKALTIGYFLFGATSQDMLITPLYYIVIPTTQGVYRCDGPFNLKNSGPVGFNRDTDGNIKKYVAAAMVRSVFQLEEWNKPETFYLENRTNVYAKILHDWAIDNKVYAFPYDDVYGNDPSLIVDLKKETIKSIDISVDIN